MIDIGLFNHIHYLLPMVWITNTIEINKYSELCTLLLMLLYLPLMIINLINITKLYLSTLS